MEKTEIHSDWKDGFLFLGNRLVLDFLNTRPLQDGQLVELLPHFEAFLRWFQAAGALSPQEAARLAREWGGTARARHTIQAMRALREKLREAVFSWEGGNSVPRAVLNELNALMAAHPMRTHLSAKGKRYSTQQWFDAREPEDLFAPLAADAAAMFAAVDAQRVRKCQNCVLHFYDTSKKGTRHWCSMQLCGNRRKVAAYAARQRHLNQKAKARS